MFHVEHRQASAEVLLKSCGHEIDIPVSPQQVEEFLIYLRELKVWNRKINLTALKTDSLIVVRHFFESLLPLKFQAIPRHQSILDIGTGAGFPGLPLKIMRPDLKITLLESSNKKVAFLRHIVGTLKLTEVLIEPTRLEEFARQDGMQHHFDVIVSRAVKVDPYLSLARRLLKQSGKVILFSRRLLEKAGSGMTLSGLVVASQHPYSLPFGYEGGVLTVLTPSLHTA